MGSKIKPDQGWSWLVLLAAFFCNATFDGIIYSFGMFYLEFLEHFQEGRSRTSWIGSVISGTYSIVGPLASILANRFGCRIVTMLGAVIASAGFILSTYSPNIWTMIITYGIMGGVGFGLMYLCAYVMIGYFFDKYRALATGIASCGSGIGTFIFAPMSVFLIEMLTWRGAMWIIAGIVLNGVVMGALFRPIPAPTNSDGSEQQRALIDLHLLCSPVFIILCVSAFLCMIGFFVPFIYLPDYAQGIGLSRGQGALLLSIIGITNTVGRVVCGFVSDKPWADALKIHNSALILGGVATMGCSWINNFPMLCVYAAIFGTCVAAYVSLTAIILVEFLGLEKLCSSFGLLNMFRGIATFIGAPLAGFLYDSRGQFDVAFYTAGAVIAAAGLICLPLRYVYSSRCSDSDVKDAEKSQPLTVDSSGNKIPSHYGDKHKQFLQDKGLYSSTLLLSGSHISVVLPNPYVSQSALASCSKDMGSSCSLSVDKSEIVTLKKTESKISQSDSCLCNQYT